MNEGDVIHAPREWWSDLYHLLIRSSWRSTILVIAGVFIAFNLVFAGCYQLTGGVDGANDFVDRFFFAVETSGTIGYGAMHPVTRAAHLVVTVEALASILLVALTTGRPAGAR